MSEPAPSSVIASRDNARVVAARRLHDRRHREREHLFLVEGPHALHEALASGAPVREVFHLWGDGSASVRAVVDEATAVGVPCLPIMGSVLQRLATTETPQGVVGVCGEMDTDLAAVPLGLACLLVEVQDPGNLGTVLRSADAAGASGVVVSTASVDLYNPKVVRASAGSLFHLSIARDVAPFEAVEGLRGRGFRILAAATYGPGSVYDQDFLDPTVVMFGNEARGLPAELLQAADATVRVPIRGRAESLNLAAAATVMLFEAARQRAEGGSGEHAS
jgi:TrmH family RNA methyltransferase